MLEFLVGKTVEQSLLETLEEEELVRIRDQQRAFEQARCAELAEQARLLHRCERLREEKETRRRQIFETRAANEEVRSKLAVRVFVRAALMNSVLSDTMHQLTQKGYFFDQVENDIEQGFLEWVYENVQHDLELEHKSRLILDRMIGEVVAERHQAYQSLDWKAGPTAGIVRKLDDEKSERALDDKSTSSQDAIGGGGGMKSASQEIRLSISSRHDDDDNDQSEATLFSCHDIDSDSSTSTEVDNNDLE